METGAGEPRSAPGPGAAAGTTTVELAVEGMHCASCAALIEESLRKEGAVRAAVVDLDAARASVTYDGSSVSVEDLCATVAGVGYSATPLVPPDQPAS
jgi:P-type Cu+ transporter